MSIFSGSKEYYVPTWYKLSIYMCYYQLIASCSIQTWHVWIACGLPRKGSFLDMDDPSAREAALGPSWTQPVDCLSA